MNLKLLARQTYLHLTYVGLVSERYTASVRSKKTCFKNQIKRKNSKK